MTVNDGRMTNLEQRARIGKIFARWHLGGDATSVWNFCARFSDVISRGSQLWRCKMSTVFSG